MRACSFFVAALFAGAAALSAAAANAMTLGFTALTSNNLTNVSAVTPQLLMDVTDAGGGLVDFKFQNVGTTPSVITHIFFDDVGGILSTSGVTKIQTAGVSFQNLALGGNLPSGDKVNFGSDFSFERTSRGGVSNGVNDGTAPTNESLTLRFALSGAAVFDDLMTQLTLGFPNGPSGTGAASGLRIGLHVQSIRAQGVATDTSESFVNIPPAPTAPVPLPAALPLLVAALAGVGALGLRRRSASA